MHDAKPQTPRVPPGSGEKIGAHPVSLSADVAKKNLRSRHSAITSDLYSYHQYKMWTAKIRSTFEDPK
jgi:hypothetical protein